MEIRPYYGYRTIHIPKLSLFTKELEVYGCWIILYNEKNIVRRYIFYKNPLIAANFKEKIRNVTFTRLKEVIPISYMKDYERYESSKLTLPFKYIITLTLKSILIKQRTTDSHIDISLPRRALVVLTDKGVFSFDEREVGSRREVFYVSKKSYSVEMAKSCLKRGNYRVSAVICEEGIFVNRELLDSSPKIMLRVVSERLQGESRLFIIDFGKFFIEIEDSQGGILIPFPERLKREVGGVWKIEV